MKHSAAMFQLPAVVSINPSPSALLFFIFLPRGKDDFCLILKKAAFWDAADGNKGVMLVRSVSSHLDSLSDIQRFANGVSDIHGARVIYSPRSEHGDPHYSRRLL